MRCEGCLEGKQNIVFSGIASTALIGYSEDGARVIFNDSKTTLEALRDLLGANHDPLARLLQTPTDIANAADNIASQHWWAEQCAGKRKQNLLTSGHARDRVRLISQAGPFATAWLSVTPSVASGIVMGDADFRQRSPRRLR